MREMGKKSSQERKGGLKAYYSFSLLLSDFYGLGWALDFAGHAKDAVWLPGGI